MHGATTAGAAEGGDTIKDMLMDVVGKKVKGKVAKKISKRVLPKVLKKIPGGSIFRRGIGRVATRLGAKLGGRIGAKIGAKAIPVVGQIATVAMAGYDAYKGWKNADQIVGKSKEQLTTTDKIAASGASVLSGMTFGLVEAKTIHDFATSDTAQKLLRNPFLNPFGAATFAMTDALRYYFR